VAGTRIFTEKYATTFALVAGVAWTLWLAVAHLGLTRFFRRRNLGADDATFLLVLASILTILWLIRVTQRYLLARSRRRV
jgi:hypothetical protein